MTDSKPPLIPLARPIVERGDFAGTERIADSGYLISGPIVAEFEAKGMLDQALLEAEEKTDEELDRIRRLLIQQGLTPQQAHDSAWETVRTRYIFLLPES